MEIEEDRMNGGVMLRMEIEGGNMNSMISVDVAV